MRSKRIGILLIVIASMSLAFAGNNRQFMIAKSMEIFTAVFKDINQYYVDDIKAGQLMDKGLESMLSSLDPYTVYIPEDKIEDYRINNDDQYVGIGATTRKIDDYHVVTMTFEGYPAQQSGLEIGDKILAVGGESVVGKSDDALRKLIKGQENTDISLTVKRYGSSDPLQLSITRKKVNVSSVSYTTVFEDNTGYIKLDQFSANCGQQVLEAFKKLKVDGASSLILDLRGNPGGLLHEAVNICNIFIPKSKKVVDTKGKNPIYSKTYSTLNPPEDTEIPIAVLINGNSASASEIVSGVLQDYDRGVLIGEKSYGKGLVQKNFQLPYKGMLKATISKYYIPSGRCIQSLDYAHRNLKGEATKIADSLINSFYTSRNREVFDGGGVSPDTIVPLESENTEFLTNLINKGLILDFASKYCYEHPDDTITEAFAISDADYEDFKQWLIDKDFVYQSEVRIIVDSMYSAHSIDSQELATAITALKERIDYSTPSFLRRDKEIVKSEISKAVIRKRFFEKGLIKYDLSRDAQLSCARNILNNEQVYHELLNE